MATTETREVRAVAKWLRITPRKARLTVEHIRGRTVPEARTVLAFTERAAAREVEKILRSAVANAEANHDLIGDELVISSVVVDEGPVIKRWRARARGRTSRIGKRTCHITLTLAPLDGATVSPTRTKAPAVPEQDAEAEPQAAGASKEKAAARREEKAAEAQAGEVSPAEEAEGAASEEKPKRSRRKKKADEGSEG
jgi:large subunit ribosomal protein L22